MDRKHQALGNSKIKEAVAKGGWGHDSAGSKYIAFSKQKTQRGEGKEGVLLVGPWQRKRERSDLKGSKERKAADTNPVTATEMGK